MTPTRWLDEDEAAAWRSWLTASNRVRAAVARDLSRDHGMSEAEYAVLVTLSEAEDHTVRMGELADALEWSRSRLSHLLSRMEVRGLVSRRECPSDARGAFASLTDAGMVEITAVAPAHVESVRRHFIDHLDRTQLRALAEAATSLVAGTAPGDCPADGGDCGG